MSNSFCKYLSNGLRVQSDWGKLMANPCCLIKSPMVYLSDPEFNQKFDKFHNLSECHDCQFQNYHMRDRAQREIQGDPENGAVAFIELSIDLDCNAACLSCTDDFSTAWVAQNKKFKIKTTDDYPDSLPQEQVVDQLFNKLDLSKLQKISFMGGEPFRAISTELVLSRVLEIANPENINLLFTTNASVKPADTLVKLMSKFKSVDIIFSLDGVNNRFEYLRYPLSWNKVCNTINYFKTLNITSFSITCTVSALNLYYCNEIQEWANDYFADDKRFFAVNFIPATGTIGLYSLPPKYKNLLLEKYSADTRLTKIISSVPGMQYSMQYNREMMAYVNRMDNFRKLSWQNTFPDVVEYFTQTSL